MADFFSESDVANASKQGGVATHFWRKCNHTNWKQNRFRSDVALRVHLYYSESDVTPDGFIDNPIVCLH